MTFNGLRKNSDKKEKKKNNAGYSQAFGFTCKAKNNHLKENLF